MSTKNQKKNPDLPEIPLLTTLYGYISGSCNLSCQHCWVCPESHDDKDAYLSIKQLKKAVTEAKPLGLQSFKLTGGEPLLHPDFKEIVSYINQEAIGMTVESNGTLIDEKMARFLKSTEKMTFISVSLDGSNAGLHEQMRGKNGCFQQALTGLKNLVAAGLTPQIICTLHKENVHDIANIVNLAKTLGCGSIKFNHVQRIGRGESFARKHGLSVTEVLEYFRHVERVIAKKSKIPIYFDIPLAFFSIKKMLEDAKKRCNIHNILGILSNGSYSLCGIGETISDLNYGNIDRDNLKDIWQNSPGLAQLRELVPHQLEGICSQCIHRNICLGTCVANNYQRSNTLNSAYYFCEEAANLGLFPETRKVN